MSKTDWGAALSTFSASTVAVLILSAFFTLGIAPLLYAVYMGLSQGTYKYCPICYTPLTAPKGTFNVSSDHIELPPAPRADQ